MGGEITYREVTSSSVYWVFEGGIFHITQLFRTKLEKQMVFMMELEEKRVVSFVPLEDRGHDRALTLSNIEFRAVYVGWCH